ncbi:hypothetical protein [Larkinella punicea]|uniref:hypothetical protein n=1 Tax=Larkinella punicea TaxID=2315727 RepID=UPI001058586B|nr:hypothetical protein [Larkinella punicea]
MTEVRGGGSEGWNGVGYTEIPYLQGSRIAIELTGVLVNECYELVGGTAVSVYDPSWGGVKNITDVTNDISKLTAYITDLIANFQGTPEEIVQLNAYNNNLDSLQNIITNRVDLTSEQKNQGVSLIDAMKGETQNIINNPTFYASAQQNIEAKESINQKLGKYQQEVSQILNIDYEEFTYILVHGGAALMEGVQGQCADYPSEQVIDNSTDWYGKLNYGKHWKLPTNQLKDIFTRGLSLVVSADIARALSSRFFSGTSQRLIFREGESFLQSLNKPGIFGVFNSYAQSIENRIFERIRDNQLNQITERNIIGDGAQAIPLPNFSNPASIPFNDMFGIMGGTQGSIITVNIYKQKNSALYMAIFGYQLMDTFGSDWDDLNDVIKGSYPALNAMFILQHLRDGFCPFITEIQLKRQGCFEIRDGTVISVDCSTISTPRQLYTK